MRFKILGDVCIVHEDNSILLTGRKTGMLLMTLLIRANQVISREELIAELWGNQPPHRAIETLHVYVSQLRKHLKQNSGREKHLVTRSSGYLMDVDPTQLDVNLLRNLIRDGRTNLRQHRPAEASLASDAAMDMIGRKTPNQISHGHIINGFVAWVEESRIACMEMNIESTLALGLHRQTISKICSFVSEYPTHELLYQYLMIALYRSNRRAEALQVYHNLRVRLRDELGLEPCSEIQELYRAILKGDELLRPPVAPAGSEVVRVMSTLT